MKSPPFDLATVVASPLLANGYGGFLRLVLAEAAGYGMPPEVVATLDDVAAMLGLYEPLPPGQASHLGGPIVQWRYDRKQQIHERIHDAERLALKQRALIAFGAAPADHQIATAEIVCALGNCDKDNMPPEFYQVFCWASVDVLAHMTQQTPASIRKAKGWPEITDADVVKPGGRLHPTYVKIATDIRRMIIATFKGDAKNPREGLVPLGVFFIKSHEVVMKQAIRDGDDATADQIRHTILMIQSMFPNIQLLTEALDRAVETAG